MWYHGTNNSLDLDSSTVVPFVLVGGENMFGFPLKGCLHWQLGL